VRDAGAPRSYRENPAPRIDAPGGGAAERGAVRAMLLHRSA